MKKFSVFLILSIVVVFVLASGVTLVGCGAPVENPAPVTPPPEAQAETPASPPAPVAEPAPAVESVPAPAPADPAAAPADPAASGAALTDDFDDFDYSAGVGAASKKR